MQRLSLPLQGIIWIIVTGFISVCIYGVALELNKHFSYHPFQIVLFYNVTGLIFYLPAILRRHVTLKTTQTKRYLLRGVLEFAGFSLSITGLTMLTMPVHTALSFTSPLFGSLAAVLFLRETTNIHRWISLLIGFLGVIMVSRPTGEILGGDISILYVLAGAVCFALCGVTIKKLTSTEPNARVAIYMMLVTAIVSLPFALSKWTPLRLEVLPYLLALGAMVATVQWTVSQAYSKTAMTILLPFSFLNLVWSSMIAYFVFSQVVDRMTIIGALVILGAAMYSIRHAGGLNMRATARVAAGSS